jgi:hypothetical protein
MIRYATTLQQQVSFHSAENAKGKCIKRTQLDCRNALTITSQAKSTIESDSVRADYLMT